MFIHKDIKEAIPNVNVNITLFLMLNKVHDNFFIPIFQIEILVLLYN